MSELIEGFEDSVNESTVDETAGIPEGAEATHVEAEAPQTDETVVKDSSEPTSEQPEEQTMVPLAAKQAEKERRQKAEDRVRQLESQIQQNQQKPDFWDNPEQAMSHMAMQLKAQMSEEFVKTQNKDYDQVMDHYQEMVQKNPALWAEAMQTGMPALHAYNAAKQDIQIQEIGDVDKFREKVRQEILQEMEEQKRSNVPPNMTTVRSAGGDPEGPQEYSNINDELMDLLDSRKRR